MIEPKGNGWKIVTSYGRERWLLPEDLYRRALDILDSGNNYRGLSTWSRYHNFELESTLGKWRRRVRVS